MVRTARLTGELYGSEMQQAFEICSCVSHEICVSLSDLSFSNSKLKVEVDNFVMYLIF